MELFNLIETHCFASPPKPAIHVVSFPANNSTSHFPVCLSTPTQPQTITYPQAWFSSSVIASELSLLVSPAASTTAQPNNHMGVMVHEGVLLPLIELAALRAGIVIVPLSPDDPPQRLSGVLLDAWPAVIVVTDKAQQARVDEALAVLTSLLQFRLECKCGEDGCVSCTISALPPNTLLRPRIVQQTVLAQRIQQQWNESQSSSKPFSFSSPQSLSLSAPSHIFFTSGSTGRPKGCICTFDNLTNYCVAKPIAHRIASNNICFVASAHTFDPSLGDFISTLCVGAAIAITARQQLLSNFPEVALASRATHILTTPSLLSLLHHPSKAPLLSQVANQLKVVAIGGEPMSKQLAEFWTNHVTLINTYGVTECCVYQACAYIREGGANRQALGTAMEGTTLFVLDVEGEKVLQCASGVVGEIWIGGKQIGTGYLNRPQLSKSKFVTHPLIGWSFRTGDLAKWNESFAAWVLVGRIDSQVKLNGQRIELTEIENVLRERAPEILRAVAVVPRTLASNSKKQLVAFYIPSKSINSNNNENNATADERTEPSLVTQENHADAGDENSIFVANGNYGGYFGGAYDHEAAEKLRLRDLLISDTLTYVCRLNLPLHMIPQAFIPVTSLPTTESGKLNRRKLTEIDIPDLPGDESASRLSDGWEKTIARVWVEEFGIPEQSVGPDTHFGYIGGDSMAAMRVCQQLHSIFTKTTKTNDHQHSSRKNEDPAGDGEAGGDFGQTLGPLAPVNLLQRPRLSEFAQHLTSLLGALEASPSSTTTGTNNTHHHHQQHHQQQHNASLPPLQLVNLLFRCAGIGCHQALTTLFAAHASGAFSASEWAKAIPAHSTTPLHVACANGHTDVVVVLLGYGLCCSVNGGDVHGVTPLMLAVHAGSVALVNVLLAAQANLSHRDSSHQSVLHHAARSGAHLKVIDLLLSHPQHTQSNRDIASSIDDLDVWQRTPLHWAVVNGHAEIVSRLVDLGANVRACDANGETPLAIAERRARCGESERPDGERASTWGSIAKILGGSGKTKNLKQNLQKS